MSKKLKFLIKIIDLLVSIVLTLFYTFNNRYRNVWLICERRDEARDNGYSFFKFMRNEHPQENVYYLIDKHSKGDYEKIKDLGNIVSYGGYKHKVLFIVANILVTAHKGTIEPWNYKLYEKTVGRLLKKKKKYIFLQHGITKDNVSDILGRTNTPFDLFITGGKPEFNYISSYFGYKANEVVYTGFPRFDAIFKKDKLTRTILLMPTWRKDIISSENEINNFTNSNYYIRFQSLINNRVFMDFLENNDFTLLFYPHYEMQIFNNSFYSYSKRVIVASKSSHDVQQLLKESVFLITDYSSVFFDFAYMYKPQIYYQFDGNDFFESHYKKGYFDYEKDGFGPVAKNEVEVINYIYTSFKNNFEIDKYYKKRIDTFFEIRDQNNCKRVYEAIVKII